MIFEIPYDAFNNPSTCSENKELKQQQGRTTTNKASAEVEKALEEKPASLNRSLFQLLPQQKKLARTFSFPTILLSSRPAPRPAVGRRLFTLLTRSLLDMGIAIGT